MTGELLLYALVAGGLVFWLRNILGTRHGEERDRSEAFMAGIDSEASPQDADDKTLSLSNEEQIEELIGNVGGVSEIEATAQSGLLAIAAADKSFDMKFFLDAVQDVFVMVVEGFGKGDKELLEDLLADDVYAAFEKAIDKREKAGDTLSNEIHAINTVKILDANLKGKMASVRILFVADEISVTRDRDDEIIAGSAERTVEMRDVWTFSRDIKSRDPRWFVAETRDDVEGGDNDTIPNSV